MKSFFFVLQKTIAKVNKIFEKRKNITTFVPKLLEI